MGDEYTMSRLKHTHGKDMKKMDMMLEDELLALNTYFYEDKMKQLKQKDEDIAAIRKNCDNLCSIFENDAQSALLRAESIESKIELLENKQENRELNKLVSYGEILIERERRFLEDRTQYLTNKIRLRMEEEQGLEEEFCRISRSLNTPEDNKSGGVANQDVAAANRMILLLKTDRDRLESQMERLQQQVA